MESEFKNHVWRINNELNHVTFNFETQASTKECVLAELAEEGFDTWVLKVTLIE